MVKQGFKPLLYLTIFFIACFVLSCQKETGLARPYPRITTLPVGNIDTSGVSFFGKYIYVDPLFEAEARGFVWSKDSMAFKETAERAELSPSESGFQYRCTAALDSGVVYYVRAFIEGQGYIVYGEPRQFVPLGSLGCRADSIIPGTWTWGDTLLIYGQNFSYQPQRNSVWLNNTEVMPISISDKLLKVNIDSNLLDNTINIIIESNGSRFTYSTTLPRMVARTETIRPFGVYVADTVTLTGKGFHPATPGLNQVFVGHRQVNLSYCSNDTIQFIVPEGITIGINTLRILVNNVPATGINELLVLEP